MMKKKLCLFCVEDAEPNCFKEHNDWVTNYPTTYFEGEDAKD